MPQPLPNYKWLLTGTKVFEHRPALAVRIANIAAGWCQIEILLGSLLATLLNAESDIGAAMYLALSGATSRNATLQGAAEHRLDTHDLQQFNELTNKVKSLQRRRNRVIHGVWAVSDDYPQALIRSDPDEHIAEFSAVPATTPAAELRETVDRAQNKRASWEIWNEQDFEEIEWGITVLFGEIWQFMIAVRSKYSGQ